MEMSTRDVIAALSLILSASLGFLYWLDRRNAKFKIENDHITLLQAWHYEVVQILIRLRDSCPDPTATKHREDLAALSATIEQGRFFLPNIDRADGYGKSKPPAYRGYRNLALDFLVAAFNLYSAPVPPNAREQGLRLQRHFTSVIFELVRPKERLDRISALTDKYFATEKSFEDFLEHPDSDALAHIWKFQS